MSIAPVTTSAAATQSTAVQAQEKSQENTRISGFQAVREAKQQLNIQILEASAQTTLSAGDNPQGLVLRSAIDRINELLAPDYGPDALQTAAATQDNSAEATAGRILSISTGFYDSYAKQHPGEDPEKVAENFVNLIRKGFEKGFGEARNILEGMNVFNGNVQSGVMKTYELVSQGYDDFLASKLGEIRGAKTEG
ncbi:MAG: DUF5610 domain-containing protein [Candidatus Accumulibacter sp.]|jgi:hypothetical protein|nr:DUF5610 domain-containing protein [Accumulibacter sp.]